VKIFLVNLAKHGINKSPTLFTARYKFNVVGGDLTHGTFQYVQKVLNKLYHSANSFANSKNANDAIGFIFLQQFYLRLNLSFTSPWGG
jgi:hypothetical protein